MKRRNYILAGVAALMACAAFVLDVGATNEATGLEVMTVSEVAAPGTPASGKVAIYAKADGLLYTKDDAGLETLASSGAAAAGGFTVFAPASSAYQIDSTTLASFTAYPSTGVETGYLEFSPTADKYAYFKIALPEAYASGSALTVKLLWAGAGAGTNSVVHGVAFGELNGMDLDSTTVANLLDDYQYSTDAAAATQGETTVSSISFTNGQADGVTAGSWVLVALYRDAQDGDDDFASASHLEGITISQ